MTRAGAALALALAACSGSMAGTPCGTTQCRAEASCCTACGGSQYCADACEPVGSCFDAGGTDAGPPGTDAGPPGTDAGPPVTDAGTDAATGSDAGTDAATPTDAGTDASTTRLDAGTDASTTRVDAGRDAGVSTGADAGPSPCPDGECRVAIDAECALPSGPLGNGCCECTNSVCTVPCRCLAADVLIATPRGEIPVTELTVGDLVYSVHEDAIVAVPILRTIATPVVDHVVVRVRLASGATLRASPIHPTADGRRFADLEAGDALDGVAILSAELEPYEGAFTYDLLPDSDSGAYFIGGVPVGSTLVR